MNTAKQAMENMEYSASRSPRIGQLVRQSFAAMTARERARLVAMYGVIASLHVAGFVILFMFVVPSHYKGLGVGVAMLVVYPLQKRAVNPIVPARARPGNPVSR
jgi:hypothetical protein